MVVGGDGGRRARGAPSFDDLTVVKRIDAATPRIFELFATGERVPEAVLTLRRTSEAGSVEFVRITLGNVRVTSLTPGGDGTGYPVETVTLRYETVQMRYTRRDSEGNAVDTIEFGWDVPRNAPL